MFRCDAPTPLSARVRLHGISMSPVRANKPAVRAIDDTTSRPREFLKAGRNSQDSPETAKRRQEIAVIQHKHRAQLREASITTKLLVYRKLPLSTMFNPHYSCLLRVRLLHTLRHGHQRSLLDCLYTLPVRVVVFFEGCSRRARA